MSSIRTMSIWCADILFRTPWFGIQVHRINRPDNDRHLHNHPRKFWAFILRGGYEEERSVRGLTTSEVKHWNVRHTYIPFNINRMTLEDFHAIRWLKRTPTWTLLVVGPSRQTWGFQTEIGFVKADDYPAYLEDMDSE